MEFLSKIHGTELPDINTPTFLHFIPLLLRNPLIQNARPHTQQYGPHSSQTLDVYIPSSGTKPAGKASKPPLLIFYYGGGYMSGRKQMSLLSPQGQTVYLPNLASLFESGDIPELKEDPTAMDRLYHQNIGTFVAAHGFVAVIPDYRLVNMDPEYKFNPVNDALFPSGAEDVMLSMKWAINNLSEFADTETVFVMGHSAGANHLATAILLPEFIPSDAELVGRLKRWCTLSATFDYIHSREQRKVAWSRYFERFEKIKKRCPTALVRGLGECEAEKLPELLCLHAKRDHFGALDPQRRFWGAWVERGGKGKLATVRGESHNHMSTIYGVGSGDEEVEGWLVDVIRWCLE